MFSTQMGLKKILSVFHLHVKVRIVHFLVNVIGLTDGCLNRGPIYVQESPCNRDLCCKGI